MREFTEYKTSGNKIYQIRYARIGQKKHDYYNFYGKVFDIATTNDATIIMSYLLEIKGDLLDKMDDNSRDLVLTRIGLSDIFNILDRDEIKNISRRICTREELDFEELDWFIKYPKICKFRKGEGMEVICELSELPNKKKLSIDCEQCAVPEDFLRCHFMSPKKDIGRPPSVVSFSARCHLGKGIDPLRVSDCLNQGCFKPTVIQSKVLKYIEEKIPKETLISQCVTLIDNINILFDNKWSFKLFKVIEYRAMLDLSSSCNSEDDFNKLILILANLIDWIDVSALKKSIKLVPSEPGSINLLDQFLKEKQFTNKDRLIKRLRRIKQISTKYPRHANNLQLITCFEELGLSYPPTAIFQRV